MLSLGLLAALPAAAAASDTFADSSRPDNGGDCLTKATACKTIGGVDGAVAKASAGSSVQVEPGTYAEKVTLRRKHKKRARRKCARKANRLPL